jgi:HCOMODA/2-hydroxy-3-carboxy-muconic semialdehyde decarboxylase
MAAFVGEGLPNFEIRDAQTGTDLLVKTPFPRAGRSPIHAGSAPAALMRGHGATGRGREPAARGWPSIYLEINARMQMQAMAIAGPGGKITYIDDAEVKASNPAQNYNRAWPAWRAEGPLCARKEMTRAP